MRCVEFFIPTRWRVAGRDERVYDVLSAPREFVRWWPEVYLAVREVRAGDSNGIGRVVALHTKGKLPYTLDWEAEVLEVDKPRRMVIRARGGLDGRGEWRFRQAGDIVEIDYDWTVRATKRWMTLLAPALKPVFVWNHVWAMNRGLAGLQRELARLSA